ncbi:MAG: DoxX family protein [Candidatus Marinimicrobia bacterium]|nr:DoxX family protein [Candidatus Neomarinimicrobiota bacterium]|tara:strand:+ start:406 stop:783 length:378 start_codon:yes stop_codon:yes gene_type:complete
MIYIKNVILVLMSIFYVNVGIKHFLEPEWFLYIIPPYLSSIGLELVYISGFFEILLGILVLFKKYRKNVCYALIILLIAVYPANIYLAFNETPQKLINITPFMASWVRLPLQFILIGLAYYFSKD